MFNPEYYIGTIDYYRQLFNRLPYVTLGSHSSKQIIRAKINDGNRYREVFEGSKNWDKYYEIVRQRELYAAEIARLEKEFNEIYKVTYRRLLPLYRIEGRVRHKYDKDFWDNIPDEQNTYEKNNNYYFDGIQFGSRAEVLIATVLKKLGLKYRYDVRIRANRNKYFVDFVVYLPQFGCCFLIEFFGRLNDKEYLDDVLTKTNDYYKEKIFPGQDIIFLGGDMNNMPSEDVIAEQIMAMVNSIAMQHVVRKQAA